MHVPPHHLPTRRIRQLGLTFAVLWVCLGVSFYELRFQEIYLPLFWPIWFAITGIATAAAVLSPERVHLVQVAGAMSVIAALSRVAGVALNWAAGSDIYTSPWRILTAFALYGMLSVGMAVFWVAEVAPWAACERRQRA